MIDYMVIGLPRSATTWAANWMTTDRSHCYHDPLYSTHYEDWDSSLGVDGIITGVSCTGIWRWPEWVNDHPAKKVILHRDVVEVNKSLGEIGMPLIPVDSSLDEIIGMHVPFDDLFNPDRAAEIWDYIFGEPMNRLRHRELCGIEMQPQFSGLTVGEEVTLRLRQELARIW